MTTSGIRQKTPGEIEEAIIDMAIKGWTPVDIERALPGVLADLRKNRKLRRNLKAPTLRTIQRIARPYRRDPNEEWRLDSLSADETALLLEWLREFVPLAKRQVRLTRREAGWIVRVQRIAPDLPAGVTARVAWSYMQRIDAGKSTDPLNYYLAFKPWTSLDANRAYDAAVSGGWIPGIDDDDFRFLWTFHTLEAMRREGVLTESKGGEE